jgi:hypothetical protein
MRFLATLGVPFVPVIPSHAPAGAPQLSQASASRPGSHRVRPDGGARRVPSRQDLRRPSACRAAG